MLKDELARYGGGVSAVEAEAIAREWFGLDTSAEPLGSERDANFHLQTAGGPDYLLKLANAAEPVEVTQFQVALTCHVAKSGSGPVPVPLPVSDRTGAFTTIIATSTGPRLARLLTWVQGVPVVRCPGGALQRQALGRTLAALDLALAGFTHPAQHRRLSWNLPQTAELRPLLADLEDRQEADLAGRALDRLEAEILPVLPALRAQVVHNDFNPHNVLVDPADPNRVTGVIDFGDSVHAPLVVDVAIAAAYHLSAEEAGFQPVRELVAAYHAHLPLQAAEVALIPDLIAVRLVATLAITARRARQHPENRHYILRNAAAARRGLFCLAGLDRHEAARALQDACGVGAAP